ncbi:uncharacterized protein LOC119721162 [Patiria miniata]|uniref:C2H2-type domain-containing protein n=1 Tax=Patiria miniata TaxID=46514 RepID=A0A913Z5F9_PATMI|nr:uncharacterized protein LOC119721162 [Patiria miniata]
MSSKRRKQNKPVKAAFIKENEGSHLETNPPTTRSRSRRRAAMTQRRKKQQKQTPEPAAPLRRSTRKRKKKQFFYATKTNKATTPSPPRSRKRKVSSSESESDNEANSIYSSQSDDEQSDGGESSGLALLAAVSNADQALANKRQQQSGRARRDASTPEAALGRKREQSVKYRGFSVSRIRKGSPSKRQKTVLDVDVLRKFSIAKLISQFSVYSSMKVPKDAFSTTVRHSYTCTMLPGICNEKFCGLLADTKNQIKRHLLRHIGELLTMTTQNSPSFTADQKPTSDGSDMEDTAQVQKETDMVTYAIPSGTRHVTVNLPRSLDIKESSYTLIRSSAGVNEVVLLPKGCLVSLASVVEELKPHQFGKSPPGKLSPLKVEQDWMDEEVIGSDNDDDGDVNDENKDEIMDEERLVENFLKEVIQDDECSMRQVLGATTQFMDSNVESNVIAPESQTVECDIEIRTKRKKYTKRYDLPREVGKCQKTTERPNRKQASSKGIEGVEPPHADHNYAFNIFGTHAEADQMASPHTDSRGQPISEPEVSDNEMVYLLPRHQVNARKAKRLKKPRPQSIKNKRKIKKEPKPPTEEDTKNKTKALEILSLLSQKSRDRKGPFTCEICGKKVTATGTLRAHYRSHAGIKPFECGQCSATFTRLHSLKYHLMIHNEQTRFMCDHCGREFRHSSHFREHLRRHTGEEPYGCTDCPLRFKTRNTYKRHLKAKHQKKLTAKGISLIIKKDKD